jgi:hypothetical protein
MIKAESWKEGTDLCPGLGFGETTVLVIRRPAVFVSRVREHFWDKFHFKITGDKAVLSAW